MLRLSALNRRARKIAGVASLLWVAGCVAITGVGDLSVGDLLGDAGSALPEGSVNLGDGSAMLPDGNIIAIDDSGEPIEDAGIDVARPPEDAGKDAGVDSGKDSGVDSGTDAGVDSGTAAPKPSVACQGITCSGQTPVCCYATSSPTASCTSSTATCPIFIGFNCDDDSDCASGTVCCVRSNPVFFGASSQCAASCTGGAMRACPDDTYCQKLGQGSCQQVTYGPSTIKGCASANPPDN